MTIDISNTAHSDSPTPKIKRRIWWENAIFVVLTHLISLYAVIAYTPRWQTVVLTAFIYQFATMGITMGYHRLWSHRSYTASPTLQVILAIAGTLGFQGSAKWWILRHRLHHRYVDSDNDPYNAKRGFWFSHIGWIFEKTPYARMKLIDSKDLDSNPILKFQHEYYVPLAVFFGIILPTGLGWFWNDMVGTFLYAGYVSRVLIWHATFCINSFAHMLGEQDFSTENTSRGNWLLALVTQGEGHHNFHHEFPKDYRNGVHAMDWDPTKWAIAVAEKFGFASNLHRVEMSTILKSKLATTKERLDGLTHSHVPHESELPTWTNQEFQQRYQDSIKDGLDLCILDGYVLDVTDFKETHPGGAALITNYSGKDATSGFYGRLNNHTRSARMIMESLRIAKLNSTVSVSAPNQKRGKVSSEVFLSKEE